MSILIHWMGHSHGDPENIFGSIADALFSQDKYLAGEFDFRQSEDDCGHVDVTITLQEVSK